MVIGQIDKDIILIYVILTVFIIVVIVDTYLINNNSDRISKETEIIKNNTKIVQQLNLDEHKLLNKSSSSH